MALKLYVTLLLAVSITVRGQIFEHENYDYCDPKLKLCDMPSDHTMCKYPVEGLSSQCTPTIHEPLSQSEKKMILFWHNKFRSNVANGTEKNKNRKLPTSSNMRQIYWDKELEAIATRWAEQCMSSTSTEIYDKCRNTKRFHVSQNIGTRKVNGTSFEKQGSQIVVSWFKESKDFDPALVDKFVPAEDKISIRQFSNIIWADVYTIGCARVIFQEDLPVADKQSKRKTTWTIERLICNYGPGGNEIGKPVYKRGASCENCPAGTTCSQTFHGLCAIQNVFGQEVFCQRCLSLTRSSRVTQRRANTMLGSLDEENLPDKRMSEKSENQQNVGNQEIKEEITTESEVSQVTQELGVTLSSLDDNTKQSPVTDTIIPEEHEERFLAEPIAPKKDEDETVENTTEDMNKQTMTTTISEKAQIFDDPTKHRSSPKPTAGKTFRKKVHSDMNENEILDYSKRKWLVGKKSIRSVFRVQQEDGSPCNCDDIIADDSTRAKAFNKLHFLLLSIFYLLIQ